MRRNEVKKSNASERGLVVAPESKAKDKTALRRMNEPLRAVFKKVSRIVVEWNRVDVLARYDVGAEVLHVQRSSKRYGDNAVQLLAAGLGVSDSVLYAASAVAKIWARTEISALLREKNSVGLGISWSHLIEIAEVSAASERQALTARCFAESLTVSALRRAKSPSPAKRGPRATEVPEAATAGEVPRVLHARILKIRASADVIIADSPVVAEELEAACNRGIDLRTVMEDCKTMFAALARMHSAVSSLGACVERTFALKGTGE